ncbi:MAG TPA: HAMP domain-containing sensor histidine kinase [Acidimicrobiia bacterium]|nr:HAMP domain-containing sensor histidine kinase [Acidimicrobiia bacterium]
MIVLSGTVATVTVVANASASSDVKAEAERMLLISDMQSAVRVESEAAALFVAGLPGSDAMDGVEDHMEGMTGNEQQGSAMGVDSDDHDASRGSDLSDHPDVVAAAAAFAVSASRIRSEGTAEERVRADDAIEAQNVFLTSLTRLNAAAHGAEDAMSLYHNDTQLAETDLMVAVADLRDQTSRGLADAVERTDRSQTLLTIILPLAAGAGAVAAVGFFRSRAAWRRLKFLEDLVLAKDRFIGTVSHELRTPLAAIVGFAALLGSDMSLGESERREYHSLILNQGNEVTAIVEDLLVAARAEIGELTIADKPIDLGAQLRQVLEALTSPLSSVRVTGQRLEAWGDPGRVRQIIRNLLTNADRHGGEHISVELAAEGASAVVRVLDDGDPIPEIQREAIFEPYTTLTTDRPVTGSIGLGLAVSRQLAVMMGGDLRYAYRDGHSVFELRLRLIDKAPDPADMLRDDRYLTASQSRGAGQA